MSPAPKIPNAAVDLQMRLPVHVMGRNGYDADGHCVHIEPPVGNASLERARAEAWALAVNTLFRDQIAPHLREVAA